MPGPRPSLGWLTTNGSLTPERPDLAHRTGCAKVHGARPIDWDVIDKAVGTPKANPTPVRVKHTSRSNRAKSSRIDTPTNAGPILTRMSLAT